MMEKILFHEEEPTEIHVVAQPFDDTTLCGERLPVGDCVHVINDKIPVTCKECYCLSDFDEK
jgi:hypothetical protein